jgi:hypothetical protein
MLYNVNEILHVIIYSNWLWLVLYQEVIGLICSEFMDCKYIQIQIQIWHANCFEFERPVLIHQWCICSVVHKPETEMPVNQQWLVLRKTSIQIQGFFDGRAS